MKGYRMLRHDEVIVPGDQYIHIGYDPQALLSWREASISVGLSVKEAMSKWSLSAFRRKVVACRQALPEDDK